MKTERTLWTGAQIYDTERACFCPGSLLVRDGLIEAVLPPMQTTQIDAQTRQANGCLLVPGLVDVHTHGRLGFDFCDATAEQMRQMRRSYALDGTTTLLPTIASAPFAQMLQAVQRVQEAGFDGVHIEGRYLSPIRRGAHAPQLLCLPQPAEAELLLDAAHGGAFHFTLAPELPGAAETIRAVCRRGGSCGIGHSDASYEQALQALDWGCTAFTHLYNCMPPLHHRAPGCAGAALSTDAFCEIISDGFHLHPGMVRMTQRCKQAQKLVLITDSMSATGCPDGEYAIAGISVTVKDGKALNAEGHIAGSTISLWTGLRRFMQFCELSLEQALPYATSNPARMVGLQNCCGALRAGLRADFLVLQKEQKGLDFSIASVWARGQRIE